MTSNTPWVKNSDNIVVYPLIPASSDLQLFSGAQGPAGALVNQSVTHANLTQPAQVGILKKYLCI